MQNELDELIKNIEGATVVRIGGLFNGDTPVQFSDEQKQFQRLKPQIIEYVRKAYSLGTLKGFDKASGCVPSHRIISNAYYGGFMNARMTMLSNLAAARKELTKEV